MDDSVDMIVYNLDSNRIVIGLRINFIVVKVKMISTHLHDMGSDNLAEEREFLMKENLTFSFCAVGGGVVSKKKSLSI